MRIIAHRSGPCMYPEQTVASALNAQREGAAMIELDVRYSKDKKIVISHDKNLGRVFGVDVDTDMLTESEFLSLRHKNAPAYPSHRFLDYVLSGVAPLLIHIKEDEVINDLIAIIKENCYTNKVVFGVHSVSLANHIKSIDPSFKVLAFMPDLKDLDAFASIAVDYIRLWEQWCTKENVTRIQDSGKEAWIMTNGSEVGVTKREALKEMLALGVDGILINDINELKAVIE